jgi:hypothetical protein
MWGNSLGFLSLTTLEYNTAQALSREKLAPMHFSGKTKVARLHAGPLRKLLGVWIQKAAEQRALVSRHFPVVEKTSDRRGLMYGEISFSIRFKF